MEKAREREEGEIEREEGRERRGNSGGVERGG